MITNALTIERGLRLTAGVFVLLTILLGLLVSPWWFAFTAFVGINLLQSAFTNWCPMMTFLRWFGFHGESEVHQH